MGLNLPLFDKFDSNADMYSSLKDAKAMYIHALMFQQCNPIVLGVHLGLKVLKNDHYYQRNNYYLPYFILHLHVGPATFVPNPFAFHGRKKDERE